MNVLRRLVTLPAAERRALWPAAWRLLVVRASLGALGAARTRAWLSRRSAGTAQLEPVETWQIRSRALQRLAARLPDTRCLACSLTLWGWMRARGLAPKLQIGIRQTQPQARGHAWVECDGQFFGETAEGAATYSLLPWRG